ncbi:DoxX family protein [Streptomyces gobiensis]|uniref:DoxX family protein n=1 Tax=Streptomyces gobiensis TaxID=2875706 RepID=UPI001E6524E3|nr:DoxX family membrane protein [Streptomyces gobiensis]UGY92131.1 DoxX family membrane protein [Streptomyces gobiensis]
MSVDTRTPRTPTGGTPGGFLDDEPVLSSVKVPSDPAQVIVSNASFRVKLATPPSSSALADTTRLSAVGGPKRRAPLVWSGRTEPGDSDASQLLQAVRSSSAHPEEPAGVATQVLPRITPGLPTELEATRAIVAPRGPEPPEKALLDGVRPAEGAYDAYDGQPYDADLAYDLADDEDGFEGEESEDSRRARSSDSVRHAYYPGRRMNLGVVLLPLRIFLGFISIYAGMGKLTDPVYFDGGERGSMVSWLRSLEPWAIATPLHDFAVAHPVGSGLTVAFLQIIVGVLTVCGLWQRLAATLGALLSAALLLTVSWRSVPVYDAPDIIYLAAWSPLIIAGAPVYSLDARLAGEAWRRLGPRVALWELRRRVLRRGIVMATVIVGLALLIGSMLGGAVRSAEVATVPEPGEPPRNHLPGSPLPRKPGATTTTATQGPTAGPTAGQSVGPSAAPSTSAAQETSGADAGAGQTASGEPSQDQTVQAPERSVAPPPPSVPDSPSEPTAGSTSGASGGTDGAGDSDGGDTDGGSSGGGNGGSGSGGALGGLLG